MNNNMKTGLFCILTLISFFIGCSSIKELRMETTVGLAKDMDVDIKINRAIPLDITTTFSSQDINAISYIKFKNLMGSQKIRWDWYSPDGVFYTSSGNCFVKAEKGKYREETTAWHRIFIQGEKAAKHPGKWQVRIYINDEVKHNLKFHIY